MAEAGRTADGAGARAPGGTPRGQRLGVRLGRSRARHLSPPRRPAGRREAGHPAADGPRPGRLPRPRLGRLHRARRRWPRRATACSSPPTPPLGRDAIATPDAVLLPGMAVSAHGLPDRQGRRLLRPRPGPGARRHLHLRAALRRRGRPRRPRRGPRPAGRRRRHPGRGVSALGDRLGSPAGREPSTVPRTSQRAHDSRARSARPPADSLPRGRHEGQRVLGGLRRRPRG